MEKYNWLDKELYPFNTKTENIDGYKMSYVDEGVGDNLLFIHGTPSWSFEFRKLIVGLKGKFRCIAPDHIGFGLSAKPIGIDYSPAGHAIRLKLFIEKLQLKQIHLVVHDFGGPVGLSTAMEIPGNILSISILNTWMWSLNEYSHFTTPAKLIQTGLGKFLYEKLNFSAKVLIKGGFFDKRKLTKRIHDQYKNAQDKDARKAAYQFALSLLGASSWYDELWDKRFELQNIPTTIFWGMNDKLLPANLLLDKWKVGFPNANVIEIENAGHFPQEENEEIIISTLRNQ
ncbi:MAG: alpha/beta fold hydrolase [Leptospirales bacterium]